MIKTQSLIKIKQLLILAFLIYLSIATFHEIDKLEEETLANSIGEVRGNRGHRMINMGNNIFGLVYSTGSRPYATFIKNGKNNQ